MKKTILTTAMCLVAAFGKSTLPVVDYSAIAESIKQGLEQIRIYTTEVAQLQQQINMYKNMVLQSTGIASAAQIWQDAQRTYGQVMGTINGLQGYVNQSRDINYWISSAESAGATQYTQSAGYWSTTQKTANNQLVQAISKQQAQLSADAATLQRLQTQAGSTAGIKQSLDCANEMSSLMASQLMALRTLMMSEQQAVAARNGALSNNEAIGAANAQNLLNANPSVSQPHTGWSPIIQ
jgi:P-type conjugative transfer protein TrbJ